MGISKFANDSDKDKKPFHSSGYAEVAHGDTIGSTSSQSFEQRYRTEQNRKMIQRYRDSQVAKGGHLREELRRRLEAPDSSPASNDGRKHGRPFNRQAFNAGEGNTSSQPSAPSAKTTPPQRRGFSEPTGPRYNPFG